MSWKYKCTCHLNIKINHLTSAKKIQIQVRVVICFDSWEVKSYFLHLQLSSSKVLSDLYLRICPYHFSFILRSVKCVVWACVISVLHISVIPKLLVKQNTSSYSCVVLNIKRAHSKTQRLSHRCFSFFIINVHIDSRFISIQFINSFQSKVSI